MIQNKKHKILFKFATRSRVEVLFEDEKGKSIIMLVDDIIHQDIAFSGIYNYPLNDFHHKYMKKLTIK